MNTMRPANDRPLIETPERALRLIADLEAAMEGLLALLAEETALVRAGRLAEALGLAAVKAEHAATYTRLMLLARDEVAALSRFLPAETEALKRDHELFRAEVQIALAAIATARDLAEERSPAAA